VALEQLGPSLTHASVQAPDASWKASLAGLPRDVQQAAAEVARQVAVQGEAGRWHRRGDLGGSLQLDLREPTVRSTLDPPIVRGAVRRGACPEAVTASSSTHAKPCTQCRAASADLCRLSGGGAEPQPGSVG
jgi:hypothetical protein